MSLWFFDLEGEIFTKVKTEATKQLKDKYPDITFTSTDRTADSQTHYPTVYIQELSGSERGADLEGKAVNAVYYAQQVEVITNKSQAEAKTVMAVIASIYKNMSFQIVATPSFNNGTNFYRCVMRVNRTIGANDKL